MGTLDHVLRSSWCRVGRSFRRYATRISAHNEVHGSEYDYDQQNFCHGSIPKVQTTPDVSKQHTYAGLVADYPTHAPRNAAVLQRRAFSECSPRAPAAISNLGKKGMVGVRGFEPPTTASRTQCATRLRYTPSAAIVVSFAWHKVKKRAGSPRASAPIPCHRHLRLERRSKTPVNRETG